MGNKSGKYLIMDHNDLFVDMDHNEVYIKFLEFIDGDIKEIPDFNNDFNNDFLISIN
jgi:hypothetical protein